VALRFLVCAVASPDPGRGVERVVEVAAHSGDVRIGRRAGLELELPLAEISSVHARLVRRGGAWQIEDLGIDYVGKRNALVDAVTLDDIRRVAKHLIEADRLITTIVGKPVAARVEDVPG